MSEATRSSLSLSRMNRVRAVDTANATLTVEAGVPLALVQQAAAHEGLMFPLSLAAEGSCTIGGNLSTNAGGHAVLRFGNTRDLVLGIEVVLADGRIWDGLRGLRKDNTGYDLKQLFIGAEGTLGIVTAAVLKLYPAPQDARDGAGRATRRRDGDSPSRPTSGRRWATGSPASSSCPRIRSRFRASITRRCPTPAPAARGTHCCRSTTTPRIPRYPAQLERALQRGARIGPRAGRDDRAVGRTGSRTVGAAREHRGSAAPRRPQHQARHLASGLRRSPASSTRPRGSLQAALPGVRFVTFGHLGDGNLHYNLAAPEGVAAEHSLRIRRLPTASSTTSSPRMAAASAPNTGSASRSATSSSATRAPSSSI